MLSESSSNLQHHILSSDQMIRCKRMFRCSSKDLWSKMNGTVESRQSVSGFAVNDKICTDKSFSIVEDIGGFMHVPVSEYYLSVSRLVPSS